MRLVVDLSTYKGQPRVSVRRWYFDEYGDLNAGKAGIELKPDQLDAVIEALVRARDQLASAHRQGWP
ncbi:hypothetical protein HDG34_005847 [Paraburkholderia sp. HC6.4b]|uniref:transcriptional coactivator p15/PC4 family protein n=1 Tax=unclassified Paraburkholderia TaxID=2615204 RepID=UPI00160930DC|nr:MULTISPECIES: transcriptional coactivator p15/PC4 family protein [unclassified Paraburkholderia]MBB5411881.1 hypothetical protein [Paraburkholderia sp. HC6.4b]MBB5450193.1 hypothetical protein [Paraburkholderia sp. Kb1A]